MLRRRTFLVGSVAAAAALAGCTPDPVDELVDEDGAVTTTHAYGDDPAQVCDLILPAGAQRGTVILVHGGFWQAGYDRSLQDAVAADLVADGYAVWNVDYRGVGAGGGYPATFTDLAAAVDLLATVGPDAGVAIDRVAIVGHSAGGHLALWASGRHLLPADAPGAAPALSPVAACSQAGVNDLVAAQAASVGGGAVASILGISPDEPVPADLAATTSPQQMVPLGVPQLVVTGDADAIVPPWLSQDYAPVASAAGDVVALEVVAGDDHFAHLDPSSGSWAAVRSWLIDVVG